MKTFNRALIFGGAIASMGIVATILVQGEVQRTSAAPEVFLPSTEREQALDVRANPAEPSPSAIAAASDVGQGPLPDLPVDAEQFVRSESNPFRCLRDSGLECSATSDNPMIARSPAEARWMADQGYPETALREKVAGWSSSAIRQEAERSGSTAMALLALEQQAKEVVTPEEAEAVADQIGRWSVDRERRLGQPGGGAYAIASRAKALAQAYKLAEARETGSGRAWAVAAANRGLDALVLGDTLAFEHIQPFFWGGIDEFMSFSDARSALKFNYRQMRVAAHLRSHGVGIPTVSDIRIRPVPEFREIRAADGRTVQRWIGEP
jgi:hypothetical protein